MKALLTPIYEKLGGLNLSKDKNGKLDSIKHQVLIVSWACKFEVASCVSDATAQLEDWQNNPEKENP